MIPPSGVTNTKPIPARIFGTCLPLVGRIDDAPSKYISGFLLLCALPLRPGIHTLEESRKVLGVMPRSQIKLALLWPSEAYM